MPENSSVDALIAVLRCLGHIAAGTIDAETWFWN
jgi:hypothetical protein